MILVIEQGYRLKGIEQTEIEQEKGKKGHGRVWGNYESGHGVTMKQGHEVTLKQKTPVSYLSKKPGRRRRTGG